MYLSGGVLVGELVNRRKQTASRIVKLGQHLGEANALVRGKACVFATGSFGRGEASPHSDLDLFIVGKSAPDKGLGETRPSRLSRLDEICVKANLIKAARRLGFPEFSGDGRYLTHYSIHELTKTLGTEHDDVTNAFTARLLLLLESRPLLEPAVHKIVKKEVLDAYWKDYPEYKQSFVPAFLANDILRLWRTFCVNYEARRENVPRREKAKGKLKNYKLKHSRLLTCYSALIHLLALYGRNGTVTPRNAMAMTELTPTERLEWVLDQYKSSEVGKQTEALLRQYERFLRITNADEEALIRSFMQGRLRMDDAYKFGDQVFNLLNTIGNSNKLHRLLVV